MNLSDAKTIEAKFSVGDLVQHRLFNYRGVIIDVDPNFMLSDEWYEEVARSRPPKDQPWYRVLVHESNDETYVAERNLTHDPGLDPIVHPLLDEHFAAFVEGRYISGQKVN